MKVLVAGATGATGSLVVKELLKRGIEVCAIVRSVSKFSKEIKENSKFTYIEASILDISLEDMSKYIEGCDAVVSCLGHNISLKGVFGPPFKLVTRAIKLIHKAIVNNNLDRSTKIILMNTTGNRNKDLKEKVSIGEHLAFGLIRLLVPPQRDNEAAANFLRIKLGQDNMLSPWVAVRPDALIDNNEVTDYQLYPSPIRSAIFDPGKASRINVAHFMGELITNDETWNKWKGKMPVLYNKE